MATSTSIDAGFEEFPKMARYSRRVIVTEKIDGTNAQVFIVEQDGYPVPGALFEKDGLALFAGSRSRWITPQDDNFGFAAWCVEHAEDLLQLGAGRHFGEWWGAGIQRRYDQTRKRFSLFNRERWADARPACCDVVPLLYDGLLDDFSVPYTMERLRLEGSVAAPGFMKPEGIVIFHTAGNFGLKKTLEKDDMPKSKSLPTPGGAS